MSVSEWATFGRHLAVSLQDVNRGQWTNHLVDHIREAIRNRALRPGVRLPSSRTLARDLDVSRNTVLGVYDQLKAEGYLIAQHGSGTRVAAIATPAESDPVPPSRRPVAPANPGVPDPALFPRREWLRAYSAALESLPDRDLRYGDPQGYEPLRHALADYLGRVRGVVASPHQILIVNGYAQGLAVLARILPNRGINSVAVEEPGSHGTRTQLQDWDLTTPPVDVDQDGLNVDSLRASGADAVLVTPAHHYPTGVALSPPRRRQLMQWVNEQPNRLVIEDDYDAEYRYDHAPVGSLQPLNPAQTITGSSVSKTLAPALRLGWLVLPPKLVEPAVRTKATFDLGVAVPDQAALVELLRSGAFDRHLRRTRQHYRQRRQQILESLHNGLPHATITGLDAGLNVCVRFDEHINDSALADQLAAEGIHCQALSHYQQRTPAASGLVIDLTTNPAAIASACQTIRRYTAPTYAPEPHISPGPSTGPRHP